MFILAVVVVAFALGWLIRDLQFYLSKSEKSNSDESTSSSVSNYETFKVTPSDR